MEHWIGPALGAAVITAIFTVIGWFVNQRNDRRREEAQRIERLIDLQTALRAEIRSYLHNISAKEFEAAAQITLAKMAAPEGEPHIPFVPKTPPNVIFDAVVEDIHVLPTTVIDPLTLFYRQMAVITSLVDDLRSEAFANLAADRRTILFRRYADLTIYSATLADNAMKELTRSIRHARTMRTRRAALAKRLQRRKVKILMNDLGAMPAKGRAAVRRLRGQ